MTSGGAVEAIRRYAGHNVLSYQILLTYFMDLPQSENWYTYNCSYHYISACLYLISQTSINVHVCVYRLQFCFFTLTGSTSTVSSRSITGVVLTYAARWLYAYHSRSGMTVASTAVIWQISQDSNPALGQLLGPFIPVHSPLGLFPDLYWLVNPMLGNTALRCHYFSSVHSSSHKFASYSNQRYSVSGF